MNIAVIFAGGTGSRMNTKSRPKQFLELHGKPIIIYTLEKFENHNMIDGIVVVCLKSWIPFLESLLKKYNPNFLIGVPTLYEALLKTKLGKNDEKRYLCGEI